MTEIKIECEECDGTGLYVGCCERGQSAVVCTNCHGTGATTFEYTEFVGKKARDNIKRVYTKTMHFISDKDTKTTQFSKYGCTYSEWRKGAEPRPIEELTCPGIEYNNGMYHEPLPKCRDDRNKDRMGDIRDCTHYKDKAECWKAYWKKIGKVW